MDSLARVPSEPSVIRLGNLGLAFMERINPELNTSGAIKEFNPQERFAKAGVIPLHQYGHGTFCKFRISVRSGLVGVYALVVAGSVRYVGECTDLRKRFNMGYGNISPRNCFEGGQRTNCKINQRILETLKFGESVDLHFCPTPLPLRQTIEKQLVARYVPPWNGRLVTGAPPD